MKKINYIKIITYFIYIIVIIFAILAITSKFSIGGFKVLVVKSGSMEPTIKTGSIVVSKLFSDYNVNDIITYKNNDQTSETTTHRIIQKKYQENVYNFLTQGDANNSPDSSFINQNRIIGKVVISVPYLGYVTSFVRTLPGLIIIIIIPSIIIIYEEMKKIHQETKTIIRKRREKRGEAGQ